MTWLSESDYFNNAHCLPCPFFGGRPTVQDDQVGNLTWLNADIDLTQSCNAVGSVSVFRLFCKRHSRFINLLCVKCNKPSSLHFKSIHVDTGRWKPQIVWPPCFGHMEIFVLLFAFSEYSMTVITAVSDTPSRWYPHSSLLVLAQHDGTINPFLPARHTTVLETLTHSCLRFIPSHASLHKNDRLSSQMGSSCCVNTSRAELWLCDWIIWVLT
jgi:hypothetical protein